MAFLIKDARIYSLDDLGVNDILLVNDRIAAIGKDEHLIAVPPQNTSRCCPACGHTAKDNRQTQSNFECVKCGYQNNADVVGALNVLKRGQEILAAQ